MFTESDRKNLVEINGKLDKIGIRTDILLRENEKLGQCIKDERIELERTIRPDIEAIKSKLGVFVDEENVKKDEKENDDSDAKYGFMLINILKLTKMVVDLDRKVDTVMERLEKSKSCAKDEKSDSDGAAKKSGRRRKDA